MYWENVGLNGQTGLRMISMWNGYERAIAAARTTSGTTDLDRYVASEYGSCTTVASLKARRPAHPHSQPVHRPLLVTLATVLGFGPHRRSRSSKPVGQDVDGERHVPPVE